MESNQAEEELKMLEVRTRNADILEAIRSISFKPFEKKLRQSVANSVGNTGRSRLDLQKM